MGRLKPPLPTLFQRGKLTSPPFGVFFLLEAGKGRQGGIFKALKYYQISDFRFRIFSPFGISVLGFKNLGGRGDFSLPARPTYARRNTGFA
jgi:hypothetical protein